jgi:hypothetical protein
MIIKSKPRVMPTNLANSLLKFGKSENIATTIQKRAHNSVVSAEFFPLKYLNTNHTIAIIEIIGNINEYKNILSP